MNNRNGKMKFGSIRELVFGLEDGIVSTTGAVIGIAAGTGNQKVVILSGLVIVVVEALSMAAGTYLSSKSKRQLLERQIEEERQEIHADPESEREELRQMYRERGFCNEEVEALVRHITKDRELWLEEMMHKELGIGFSQLEDTKTGAAVMWLAYTVGGIVPVVPFLLFDIQTAMLIAFALGLVALFAIGAWKAKVTKTNILAGGLEMLLISAAAGVAGYVIGRLVGAATGIEVGI